MVPGVQVVVEPETHKVLLDQYSASSCRKLFPKRPSKKGTAQVKEIVDGLDDAMKLPDGQDRSSMVRELTARMDALNTENQHEDKKAVHLYIQVKCGQGRVLVDCSITHSLSN